ERGLCRLACATRAGHWSPACSSSCCRPSSFPTRRSSDLQPGSRSPRSGERRHRAAWRAVSAGCGTIARMSITAAADGSALGNPGPAGWAWYIDEDTWRARGWPHGTNNMGELKAVLDLLEATAVDADQHLLVLCDSQYVINSITKWMPGWKRKGWRKKDGKPVLNVELLQAIDRALAGRSVEFEWVKGHSG